MQLGHTLRASVPRQRKHTSTVSEPAGTKQIVDEINAYIAIRDGLLVEAEQLMTSAKIDSAVVANNFVLTCLKPARPPYEAQCLPKADAARERERCQQIQARLAELSAQVAARKPKRQFAEKY